LATEYGYNCDLATGNDALAENYFFNDSPNVFLNPFLEKLEQRGIHSFAWSADPFFTPNMYTNYQATPPVLNAYGTVVKNWLNTFTQVRPE
jgi:hypothetical protein